ncbi:MAG: 7-carboxy-7-deazaguanine synthase QueE [Planctomycetes bacterium]|nr:7-carboxy-7-deazaguanine synthase QueE [Planctomycetota bacterium]MCK5473167.1 7-carboxy-7-deazaguanine synthase QueE [Planctomycetota bacterium]
MIVSEIFYSLQGEGFLTGVPSVFIRLAGCPLRCKWCDTKYALDAKAGRDFSVEEIIKTIKKWPSRFVVITGGEPMVNLELGGLTAQLKKIGKHITIETAGIKFIANLDCDLMSISPKLGNAKMADGVSALNVAVLNELTANYKYQLKFVIDFEDDLAEIKQLLDKIKNIDLDLVMLMPQAATRDELLEKSEMVAELCRQSGFVFCQRLQILLWDGRRNI